MAYEKIQDLYYYSKGVLLLDEELERVGGWVVVSTEHLIGTDGLLVLEEEAVVADVVVVVGTRLGGPSLNPFGVTNNNYQ
jgi:hypothetical protein